MSEMHAQIHALTGAYAVDALDDIERAQFERHLTECAECAAEVLELQATAALVADDAAVPPPAGLRDRVLAEIATVRPLPPEVKVETPTDEVPAARPGDQLAGRRAARRTSRWSGLAVAAAAVIALGVTVPVVINSINDDEPGGSQVALTPTEKVLQAEDAASATVEIGDGAEATLVRSESLGQAVLVTKAMPAAPDGKTYQMWLFTDAGAIVSAGLMQPAGDQTILLSGDAARATAAAISVEPEGGSKQPTSDPVALIDFSSLEQA